MKMNTAIEIMDLRKDFGAKTAVNNLNLAVADGRSSDIDAEADRSVKRNAVAVFFDIDINKGNGGNALTVGVQGTGNRIREVVIENAGGGNLGELEDRTLRNFGI